MCTGTVTIVTLSLLLPAVAVVITLVALTLSFQRIEHELALLRVALRRSRAAAVATDELGRLSATVSARAVEIDADARVRLHRRRSRRHAAGR